VMGIKINDNQMVCSSLAAKAAFLLWYRNAQVNVHVYFVLLISWKLLFTVELILCAPAD